MMRPSKRQTWQQVRAGLVTLLAALAATTGVGRCQAPVADPVDRLRHVLQTPTETVERDRATKQCLEGLRTLAELRRALTLTEWRDRNPDSTFGSVDLANRAIVAERFQQAFRQVFARHEATSSVVAVTMLADMANTSRAAGEPANYLRPFGPDLADLVAHAPPKVQAIAARTLGLIDPDLTVAVPALSNLLHAADPNLRCAAADGLFELLQAQPAATATRGGPVSRASGLASCRGGHRLRHPAAGRKGLADWHVEVRRRCVATLGGGRGSAGAIHPRSFVGGR